MALSWPMSIQEKKLLTVFPGPTAQNDPWLSVFKKALDQFNALSDRMNLRVKLKMFGLPPDPDGNGGAHVQFEAASGKVKFAACGTQREIDIDGTALHGKTRVVHRGAEMKAFVYVPLTPLGEKGRPAGDGVKLVIAVHELIHACGLDDADHSPFSVQDIFVGIMEFDAGKTPDDDTLHSNGAPLPPKRKFFPPLLLDGVTVKKIQSIWPA
jgi:hypothetical protein